MKATWIEKHLRLTTSQFGARARTNELMKFPSNTSRAPPLARTKGCVKYTVLRSKGVIGRAKRAPYRGVQSRFRDISKCRSVDRSVGRSVVSKRGRRDYVAQARAQSHFGSVKTDLWHPCYWFRLSAIEKLYRGRKGTVHLEMVNLKRT